MDKGTKKTRVTAAQVEEKLSGRIDELASGMSQILSHLGAGEKVETQPASEAETSSEAKQTRVVKLPDLKRFPDEQRAIGVDATYTSNIALFKLGKDGTPVAKKDGGLRKPTRMRVEDAEFILAHTEEVAELCSTIRENQAASSGEQASA